VLCATAHAAEKLKTYRAMSSTKRMFEFACHEGNYSMRDMLEAARANDAKESTKVTPASAK
jgi:hypothetical protein